MSRFLSSFSICARAYSTQVQQEIARSTVKPLNSRKTYLMDIYNYMWKENSIILLAHHNNLLATDNEKLRLEFHKAGANIQFRKLKSSIFKHFLRTSNHPDPASKAAARQVKRKKIRHPLEPLLRGPTAAILIKDLDPKSVKQVSKILKSQKEKLFILGGKIGNEYVNIDEIDQFKELQSLPELRSELVGLLTLASGAGLVKTLESASQTLAITLESHKNELEKKTGPESGSEPDSKPESK